MNHRTSKALDDMYKAIGVGLYSESPVLKYLKENKMKKDTINITKDALDKTYRDGCSDVKRVLKNLFPDYEFEKPIELKWGQIYKHTDGYFRLTHIQNGWSLISLDDASWLTGLTIEEMTDSIKREGFTLCPNATIRVENG